jgi:hypothetical protein
MTTQPWQREIVAILDSLPVTFGATALCDCGCGKPAQAIFAQMRAIATASSAVVAPGDRQRYADIQGLLSVKSGAEATQLTSEKEQLEVKFRAAGQHAERERQAAFATGAVAPDGRVSDAEVQRLIGLSTVGHNHLWQEERARLRGETARR